MKKKRAEKRENESEKSLPAIYQYFISVTITIQTTAKHLDDDIAHFVHVRQLLVSKSFSSEP